MVLIGVLGQDGRREAESIKSVIHSLVSIFIDINKLSPVVSVMEDTKIFKPAPIFQ